MIDFGIERIIGLSFLADKQDSQLVPSRSFETNLALSCIVAVAML